MAEITKDPSIERVQGASSPNITSDSEASAVLQETPKRSWKSYIWDTFDKSPEERRFLFKLDAALMTLASLGYFIKYLDQVYMASPSSAVLVLTGKVNVNNAFVSGMKEDMNLFGNELNYMQTCWTIGYVIGEIPRYDYPCSWKLQSVLRS